jgi:uncharacterized protein
MGYLASPYRRVLHRRAHIAIRQPEKGKVNVGPDPKLLEELVRRCVEAVHPLRIVLFGSAARGTMGLHSDLDALVVVSDGCDCLKAMQTLHRSLSDLGVAKDVVVVQASDVERHAWNPYLIIHSALLEGKELYRAAL